MSGRKKDNIISGTPQGGKRAAQTNKERQGEGFYRRIGAIGGKVTGIKKGFGSSGKGREAGSVGGKRSKRGHKFIKHESGYNYYTSNTTGDVVKFKGE